MDIEEIRAIHGKFFCRKCASEGRAQSGHERYSMGVYAGTYCDGHWEKDGRNHNRRFDPMDAGETLEPEDYY